MTSNELAHRTIAMLRTYIVVVKIENVKQHPDNDVIRVFERLKKWRKKMINK